MKLGITLSFISDHLRGQNFLRLKLKMSICNIQKSKIYICILVKYYVFCNRTYDLSDFKVF